MRQQCWMLGIQKKSDDCGLGSVEGCGLGLCNRVWLCLWCMTAESLQPTSLPDPHCPTSEQADKKVGLLPPLVLTVSWNHTSPGPRGIPCPIPTPLPNHSKSRASLAPHRKFQCMSNKPLHTSRCMHDIISLDIQTVFRVGTKYWMMGPSCSASTR